jgi:hypothetical protein
MSRVVPCQRWRLLSALLAAVQWKTWLFSRDVSRETSRQPLPISGQALFPDKTQALDQEKKTSGQQ